MNTTVRKIVIVNLVLVVLLASCKDHGIGRYTSPKKDATTLCNCMGKIYDNPDHADYCKEMTIILENKYKKSAPKLVEFANAMAECKHMRNPKK